MIATDEGKFKINGIDATMQCILMDAKRNEQEPTIFHYHEYIEILFGVDCDLKIAINDKSYPLTDGDLIIVNSMESHSVGCLRKERNTYIVVKFSPQQIYTSEQSLFELKYLIPFIINNPETNRRIPNEALQETHVPDALKTILHEWQTKEYGYELAMRTKIMETLLWVLRFWKQNNIAMTQDNVPPMLLKAVPYISAHLSEVTAESTADYCGYSCTYFSELFKKAMHIHFRDYVLKLRISKAEHLLLSTNDDITEIAFSVGFSTSSHFIKQFKSVTGITPLQYRKRAHEF